MILMHPVSTEKATKIMELENKITFVVDRNINYTNICTCKCKFCAFHKDKDEKGVYVLEYQVIKRKIDELVSVEGTQLLLQGGLNPDIPLEYYLELIKNLRKDYPNLTIHSFSPSEISFIAKNNNLTPQKLLEMFITSRQRVVMQTLARRRRILILRSSTLMEPVAFLNAPSLPAILFWFAEEIMERG